MGYSTVNIAAIFDESGVIKSLVHSNNIDVEALREKALSCRYCSGLVAHQPNPVFILNPGAKIALISQAPGRLAHQSGLAWDDSSGDRLRDWLGLSREEFYSSEKVSVIPMSFCFPGYKNGADAPPIVAMRAALAFGFFTRCITFANYIYWSLRATSLLATLLASYRRCCRLEVSSTKQGSTTSPFRA